MHFVQSSDVADRYTDRSTIQVRTPCLFSTEEVTQKKKLMETGWEEHLFKCILYVHLYIYKNISYIL